MKSKQITFDAFIEKFGDQGEKTGWHYVEISPILAQQLFPGNKKSFRASGKIDDFVIDKVALMPMGKGTFIIPLNATIRKGLKKKEGNKVTLKIKHDTGKIALDNDLLECLEEEPLAKKFFLSLTPGHRNYFSKWISESKTDVTKAKRIALTIDAMLNEMDFGEMLRKNKKK